MKFLFALTLFLGAVLLFFVQPMIGKFVLPLLGGSPAVWITCMVFFQAALLAGYLYAHVTTAWLGIGRQTILHAVLSVLLLALLPVGIGSNATPIRHSGSDPTWWLLGILLRSVGLPFFVVASTAPLLQRWFAATGDRDAEDPYFLYSVSNLGSMVALLAYPFLIEPSLRLSEQSHLWSAGYGLLVALLLSSAVVMRYTSPAVSRVAVGQGEHLPGIGNWLRWVVLAFVPSSWMLGVTSYITTDIASMPLLWVIPLALYLLTFILVFSKRSLIPHSWMLRSFPLAVMVLAPALGAGLVQTFWLPIHLLTFFLGAMYCHGELARQRPAARRLTSFYLALSLGGVLGGVFNALFAPLVFNRLAEYPLAIVLACLLLPGSDADLNNPKKLVRTMAIPASILVLMAGLVTNVAGVSNSPLGFIGVMLISGLVALACWTHRNRPARFALSLGAVLLASGLWPGVDGLVLLRARSFYGAWRVTDVEPGRLHRLFHGTTLHGQQSLDPARRFEPLSYFSRAGPIGQVFDAIRSRIKEANIAVAGLGAGSLACYAEPDQHWTFYEIDPTIASLARDPRYFSFLSDCRAKSLEIVLGDARIRLHDAQDHHYGLIILDAFSSDAIPLHLLTREALELYQSKLAPGGMIVFQITNRYVDFAPVLGALARNAKLLCRVRVDLDLTPEEKQNGKQPSIWAVMVEREADLGALANDPRWQAPRVRAGEAVWTDDFSNLSEHFMISRR